MMIPLPGVGCVSFVGQHEKRFLDLEDVSCLCWPPVFSFLYCYDCFWGFGLFVLGGLRLLAP